MLCFSWCELVIRFLSSSRWRLWVWCSAQGICGHLRVCRWILGTLGTSRSKYSALTSKWSVCELRFRQSRSVCALIFNLTPICPSSCLIQHMSSLFLCFTLLCANGWIRALSPGWFCSEKHPSSDFPYLITPVTDHLTYTQLGILFWHLFCSKHLNMQFILDYWSRLNWRKNTETFLNTVLEETWLLFDYILSWFLQFCLCGQHNSSVVVRMLSLWFTRFHYEQFFFFECFF